MPYREICKRFVSGFPENIVLSAGDENRAFRLALDPAAYYIIASSNTEKK